ncbi:1,4-alpha-glucan branching protein GlgB [Aneurinibacillus danicus]|jgi:1,4-alpha-glucan branching enzyme|uniref:1,4-alpha-glucan branching enzyme GlgB n=1 Tax=Aneurinibacillus danicus TaxID=267746 RepID=A0A511V7X0_9BACL|nr:1,4-alpha-glucan branching protein GlgB [Aneurinibacillus danicus]GEN33793.1 1,4-alpha-glucan branching enzyme GlgB [Aneurinibacillus danicus]
MYPDKEALYLFHEGNLFRSYRLFGAHLCREEGQTGVRFTVWAPEAAKVSIVGEFNEWQGEGHEMFKMPGTGGVWSLFIAGLSEGSLYKYEIKTASGGTLLKADPYAFRSEVRPNTASVVHSPDAYRWSDAEWLVRRDTSDPLRKPINIYELHAGTWKKKDDGSFYSYRELADEAIDYVKEMGYTHMELLPLAEHPFDRSWGYQVTGYFSATSRYGPPEDFQYFVDRCHQHGIGVILDWVPGHFCKDAHGLMQFDGTPLYEYADVHKADTGEWGTLMFDVGKPEVVSFLISNALFWMDKYHIDGLRVDAVASMLYLDFGKPEGRWRPNRYGGHENLEAVEFLKKLNEAVFDAYPGALMIAEESTAWPRVSAPTYLGGLGFNFKWNMGWMNDVLKYMEMDPVHRKWHHELLTFSFFYTFSENFVLPLSHDEVVYGKRALLAKMPGDYWQKFANLRVLYGYMIAHPGKKLLFMGGEIGQFDEWKDEAEIDWHLLQYDMHHKIQAYVKTLNHIYQKERALWEYDHEPRGFEWIDPHDSNQSILTFIRQGAQPDDSLLVVCNFTPVVRSEYRIGVPTPGMYLEYFNSDDVCFGGSGVTNPKLIEAKPIPWHNRPHSISLTIPPLACVFLKLHNFKVKEGER